MGCRIRWSGCPVSCLSALVGLLEAFRVLLLQPIFDQVLRPDAPEGPIVIGLANKPWHFDLRILAPHFMHNAWTVVAYALIVSTLPEGALRLLSAPTW